MLLVVGVFTAATPLLLNQPQRGSYEHEKYYFTPTKKHLRGQIDRDGCTRMLRGGFYVVFCVTRYVFFTTDVGLTMTAFLSPLARVNNLESVYFDL